MHLEKNRTYACTFPVQRKEINVVKVRFTMRYSSRKLSNGKVITTACNFWRQIACSFQVMSRNILILGKKNIWNPPIFSNPARGSGQKKFTHAHYVFPPWRGLPVQSSLAPSRPRRFRMWRHLPSLSGKFAKETSRYHTRFQASSGNSDSANWPGYEAVFSNYWIDRFTDTAAILN